VAGCSGFKAGNLVFVLNHCDWLYVAIFDADFVPPTVFLRRTVPALVADSGLAYVQARWGHANRTKNWLTRAQGMLLDAHFAVEQEARFRAGLPMSFNGTAGVWSRAAIDNGGGWTGDTLTEDRPVDALCDEGLAHGVDVGSKCRRLPGTATAWRAQRARAGPRVMRRRAQAHAADLGECDAALEKAAMTLQMISSPSTRSLSSVRDHLTLCTWASSTS
jgi:hypothetical protein